jgi:hypothetical protein
LFDAGLFGHGVHTERPEAVAGQDHPDGFDQPIGGGPAVS